MKIILDENSIGNCSWSFNGGYIFARHNALVFNLKSNLNSINVAIGFGDKTPSTSDFKDKSTFENISCFYKLILNHLMIIYGFDYFVYNNENSNYYNDKFIIKPSANPNQQWPTIVIDYWWYNEWKNSTNDLFKLWPLLDFEIKKYIENFLKKHSSFNDGLLYEKSSSLLYNDNYHKIIYPHLYLDVNEEDIDVNDRLEIWLDIKKFLNLLLENIINDLKNKNVKQFSIKNIYSNINTATNSCEATLNLQINIYTQI